MGDTSCVFLLNFNVLLATVERYVGDKLSLRVDVLRDFRILSAPEKFSRRVWILIKWH